jgi:hypothetical protein
VPGQYYNALLSLFINIYDHRWDASVFLRAGSIELFLTRLQTLISMRSISIGERMPERRHVGLKKYKTVSEVGNSTAVSNLDIRDDRGGQNFPFYTIRYRG